MADNKLSIRLKIAGREYPLGVNPEKEEVYRRAESEINGYVVQMRNHFGSSLDDNGCLALAALKFAIDKIELSRSREVGDEDMKALENIDMRLERYLNSLVANE